MHREDHKIVFIVDDDMMFANMLREDLAQNENWDVRTFYTGEDCVKELLHTHPNAIVIDYLLNSNFKDALNGLQILDIIRKLDKRVHIIMLSGQERYGIALQAIQHGAERYVIKDPDSFVEVKEIISAI